MNTPARSAPDADEAGVAAQTAAWLGQGPQALLRRLRRAGGRLRVVIGATTWTVNGVNVFSMNLARGLCAAGVDAEVLLTEEDSDLVQYAERRLPRPEGVRFTRLPLAREASWGAHWGALLRYLQDAAPCVYIPNSDWRHSSICPLLPAEVLVIGLVHSDDPLHYDHVRRLGRHWNLAVATSDTVARRTVEACPEVAGRLLTIPIGVHIPDRLAPRPPPGPVLRVIYHGVLKQHQKRVLDLPRIVQAALARGVPVVLNIIGAGPDEDRLRQAAAPGVASGAIRFHGLVAPDAIGPLLDAADVYLLASEFEGMPNALIEAMGRGCVPVVTRMDSGIPQLISDGADGLLVPIGDAEAFGDALQALWLDPARRQRMAAQARHKVMAGGFRVEDMVRAYRQAIARVRAEARRGAWRRPGGELDHPPPRVAGVELFPVALPHHVAGCGRFISQDDADDFAAARRPRAAVPPPWSSAQRLARAAARQRLQGLPVFVAAPVWTDNGVNAWSAELVRELAAAGLDARLLLTEEATTLVQIDSPRLPRPAGLKVQTLSVAGSDGWGARWGTLQRLLEGAAPCVYIPNYDWRHACITPLLAPGVIVIGTAHDDGALYREQALRLGAGWNAVLSPHRGVLRHLREASPDLAPRLHHLAWHAPAAAGDPAMRAACLALIRRCLAEVELGLFRRPAGPLRPPPAAIEGTGIFPVDLHWTAHPAGPFPSEADALAFDQAGGRPPAAPGERP